MGRNGRHEVGAGLRTRRGKWAEKGGGPRVIKRVHTRFRALSLLLFLLVWVCARLLGSLLRLAAVHHSLLFAWALWPSTAREGEPGAETISPRSRDCADGTERPPFTTALSERAGLQHVQARSTSSVTTQEGLEERSHRGTTRSGKSRLLFPFIGFCVNDCGRRLWD